MNILTGTRVKSTIDVGEKKEKIDSQLFVPTASDHLLSTGSPATSNYGSYSSTITHGGRSHNQKQSAISSTRSRCWPEQAGEQKEESQESQESQAERGIAGEEIDHVSELNLLPSASDHNPNWHLLPTDMIYTVASGLDARSLVRLERVDKFTQAAIAKHNIVLWSALADQAESKTRWISSRERDQLAKFEQSEIMLIQRVENPKRYFILRTSLIQEIHHRLLTAQQNRLTSVRYKQRSLALRWYDEIILPICLLSLLALFVIFLTYELQTNDGSVTWMTMSPLLTFFGLITVSLCALSGLRCRVHTEDAHAAQEYDISHLIPNDYVRESNSFISAFVNTMIHPIVPNRQISLSELTQRFLVVSTSIIGLLTCILFLSLRVTGEINWNWALIFTPFFISMSLIYFMGFFRPLPGHLGAFAIGLLLLFLPVIIFIILLTVYLNHGGSTSSLHLQYVFIPLYMIDAVTFLYTFIPSFGNLIVKLQNGDLDRAAFLLGCAACLGWIIFIGPFLYLKIVLGLRADRSSGNMIESNLALFLPLLSPVLLLIGAFIYYVVAGGVGRSLIDRAEEIAMESRQLALEPRVPSTVQEMENDASFLVVNAVAEQDPLLAAAQHS